MTAQPRFHLLRSVLYVPGSNPKTLAKAPTLPADGLILDLEDSVAPEAKIQARHNILATLHATRDHYPGARVVRVNGIHTDLWRDDLAVVLAGRPDAIALSKVESPASLERLAAAMREIAPDGMCALWPMIESPLGVLQAHAIATHPLVSMVVMGTSDLGRALGLPGDPERIGLRHALQQTLMAARAAGRGILDGVFVNIRDPEGFLAECHDGARLGFDGKTVIHPAQIEPANRIFLPSDADAETARRILDAWNQARARGEEICVVDGKLVERLHADQANQCLSRWKNAQKRDED
ncbi:MAG: CoA ester lyase [Magnetococcales bacterium]|nr:CoA ester lyase [Magnetococcales bacterium]